MALGPPALHSLIWFLSSLSEEHKVAISIFEFQAPSTRLQMAIVRASQSDVLKLTRPSLQSFVVRHLCGHLCDVDVVFNYRNHSLNSKPLLSLIAR